MISRRKAIAALGAAPAAAAAAAAQPAAARSGGAIDASAPITTPPECQVKTGAGAIQGYRRGAIYTFKGVPYGADTAGAARFLPPWPPRPWTGVRKTLTYGPTSPQPVRDRSNFDLDFINDWDDGFANEDCLVLNVWTGAMGKAARRPVMVWLHGGGFTAGSSQEFTSYDGTNLAKRGVVLVSVNHRLGPLGFLDLSAVGGAPYAASGNVGMMDIVASLQWIRDNIESFGGDPSRVTVFGQSGGGFKVSALMAMPSAQGLYHRGIVMSGSNPPAHAQADARALTEATMAELGVHDVAGLQGADPAKLILAGAAASARLAKVGHAVAWGPVLDGQVVTADWKDGAPAMSANVPMIIGNVRDEFRHWDHAPTMAEVEGFVPARYAAETPKIIAALKTAYPNARPVDIGGMITGIPWRNQALEQARKKHAQNAGAVYSYWLTYVAPHFDGGLGCSHCQDIPFAFDNVALADQRTGNTPEAHRLAGQVAQAFVNFAATGDPSQPGLAWTRYEPATAPTMVFDKVSRVERDPAGAARRLMA